LFMSCSHSSVACWGWRQENHPQCRL
jgi:hypothetical protein